MADLAEPRTVRSVLEVVRSCDSFFTNPTSSASTCLPLIIGSKRVGTIRPDVLQELKQHTAVFQFDAGQVVVLPSLNVADRSAAFKKIVEEWRAKDRFKALRGWRAELCPVMEKGLFSTLLLELERSALGLFGFRSFGVHLNGFFREGYERQLRLWIARRSYNKPTWPGMLDNFVAGGMPIGASLIDNLVKECEEEAGIPPELARQANAVGAISYFVELETGLHPETQYCYDLELPLGFRPVAQDGEVEQFYCWTPEETLRHILLGEFKPNSAVVLIHFLIRHGVINASTEPDYLEILSSMNRLL